MTSRADRRLPPWIRSRNGNYGQVGFWLALIKSADPAPLTKVPLTTPVGSLTIPGLESRAVYVLAPRFSAGAVGPAAGWLQRRQVRDPDRRCGPRPHRADGRLRRAGFTAFSYPVVSTGLIAQVAIAVDSRDAGRSFFITGKTPKRTGLLKVGIPGAPVGLQVRDVTIAMSRRGGGRTPGPRLEVEALRLTGSR